MLRRVIIAFLVLGVVSWVSADNYGIENVGNDPFASMIAGNRMSSIRMHGTRSGHMKVHVSKSRQRMYVHVGNRLVRNWRVSTARRGYSTPSGTYRPRSYSKKYHNSPMPYSIFFKGGYAIHGTYATRHLGRRASHGCVRLHPSNARRLYHLIQQHGISNTRITIS